MTVSLAEMLTRETPEDRERVRRQTEVLFAEVSLAELRNSLGSTQQDVAERLHIKQANVAKAEKRDDMLVSTARRLVEALGGKLFLIAEMPDGKTHRLDIGK